MKKYKIVEEGNRNAVHGTGIYGEVRKGQIQKEIDSGERNKYLVDKNVKLIIIEDLN